MICAGIRSLITGLVGLYQARRMMRAQRLG